MCSRPGAGGEEQAGGAAAGSRGEATVQEEADQGAAGRPSGGNASPYTRMANRVYILRLIPSSFFT